jgi:hypothetical protein
VVPLVAFVVTACPARLHAPTHRTCTQVAAAGKRVHVLVPDLGEYGRSYKIFRPAIEQIGGGVTLGHLKEALKGPDLLNSFQVGGWAAAALAVHLWFLRQRRYGLGRRA